MIRKKPLRAISLALSVALLFTCNHSSVYAQAADAEGQGGGSGPAAVTYSDERITHNYAAVSREFTYDAWKGDRIAYPVPEIEITGTAKTTTESYGYDKSSEVVVADIGEEAELTIQVEKAGLYWLSFDYVSCADSILPAEAALMVNGEFPYYELRSLKFENLWVDAEEPSFDRYGNQMRVAEQIHSSFQLPLFSASGSAAGGRQQYAELYGRRGASDARQRLSVPAAGNSRIYGFRESGGRRNHRDPGRKPDLAQRFCDPRNLRVQHECLSL